MEWHNWDEQKPEEGQKIIIVCSDGCSSSTALMSESGPLDGEDAWELGKDFTNGAIWLLLPVDYTLAFMDRHDDY